MPSHPAPAGRPGAWHVLLRGADRLPPWPKDRDRFVFLALLRRALASGGAACDGFCLIPSGARLLLTAASPGDLRGVLEPCLRAYGCYWRRWYSPRLRAFQPARAVALPEALRWSALAHLETEPSRAGLCGAAWEYRWSSAMPHCGLGPSYLPLAAEGWRQSWTPGRWRSRLAQGPDEWRVLKELADLLRQARPLRALAEPAAEPPLPPLLEAQFAVARAAAGRI